MRYLNIFYLFVLIVGATLWWLNKSMNMEVVTFFGFAENKETEINFNYSVAVAKIHVSPGALVKKGAPLIDMYRIKSKETLADQPYRITELRAKANSWKTEKEGDIKLIESKKQLKLEEIVSEIEKLKTAQQFQSDLYKDLKTVEEGATTNSLNEAKILALQKESRLIAETFDQEIQNIQTEIAVGTNPYKVEIKRLQAEQAFEETNKRTDLQLTAPTDGVIGNIYCKEAEHIPSYKTLMSFYEPNPSLVKGFVQEDLILHVALKDSFLIRSTKDVNTFCFGMVTGLGSRIVEIPDRLRKMQGLKTYGREILISIPKQNNFLQKEKVILEFINPPKGVKNIHPKAPTVELKVGK